MAEEETFRKLQRSTFDVLIADMYAQFETHNSRLHIIEKHHWTHKEYLDELDARLMRKFRTVK